MITRELLEKIEKKNYEWFKKHNPICLPKPLFINNVFNPDNWNSGIAHLIRDFADDLRDYGNVYTGEFDFEDYSGDIVVTKVSYNDQTYVSIVVMKIIEHEAVFEQYLVTYYKERGRTELITKNGHPITLDEYIELLNILEKSGYEFKIIEKILRVKK